MGFFLAYYLPVSLDFTIHVKVILGTVLRAPKSRWWLAAATGDAAMPIVGVRCLGQAWVESWISFQGDHSTFHLPKSPHTSFLWLLQPRPEERGKAL